MLQSERLASSHLLFYSPDGTEGHFGSKDGRHLEAGLCSEAFSDMQKRKEKLDRQISLSLLNKERF